MQMPMPNNLLESEMIGAIKIKDGLFIGDELASTVSQAISDYFSSHRYWKNEAMLKRLLFESSLRTVVAPS